MWGRRVAWIAAIGLTLLPFAAHAGSGVVDEMKLGVLDHDVPIGGDHKECCVDANLTSHNPGLTNLGLRMGFRF